MTAPATPPAAVTQEDRDAAVKIASLTGCDGTTMWAISDGNSDDHPFVQAFARHRLAFAPPAASSAERGWIVGNGDGTKWRAWNASVPVWTDDRELAIRYARRQDAEAVHAEDEDAWRVVPFDISTPPKPAVDAEREALERAAKVAHDYAEHELAMAGQNEAQSRRRLAERDAARAIEARIRALITPPTDREDAACWRHVKRGTVYEMIGTAELQAEQPQSEHAALAIYRGEDGKLWARNTAEFHDGRFVPVITPTDSDIAPPGSVARGEGL